MSTAPTRTSPLQPPRSATVAHPLSVHGAERVPFVVEVGGVDVRPEVIGPWPGTDQQLSSYEFGVEFPSFSARVISRRLRWSSPGETRPCLIQHRIRAKLDADQIRCDAPPGLRRIGHELKQVGVEGAVF